MLKFQDKEVAIHQGKMQDVLATFPDNCIDTGITDPPYHLQSIVDRFGKKGSKPPTGGTEGTRGVYGRSAIGFMGQEWDGGDVAFDPETWGHVFRVMKPGGLLFCFGGTRTWHRIAVAIEDAGFDIRDNIAWLYGQGFPKSHNIGKNMGKADLPEAELWSGWGTSLKPAFEPIIIAMKPIEGTFVNNALTHGVAGYNIDGGRIPTNGEEVVINTWDNGAKPFGDGAGNPFTSRFEERGRWPSNVILDEEAAEMLDEQAGVRTSGTRKSSYDVGAAGDGEHMVNHGIYGKYKKRPYPEDVPASSGGASRFFYTAKASRSEKDAGLEDKNIHPTVKPIELMRYLCKLSATPTGGIVLDPFMGSGSTGAAALLEGRKFIGIDMTPEYVDLAINRINHWRPK